MSSGLVGSSIQYGSNSASRRIHSIASPTPQRWFASTASIASGPISSRTIRARRRSSSTSAPDLELEAGPALGQRLAAQPPDLVVVVAEPADRCRVGRVAVATQLRLALGAGRGQASQAGERALRRQGVGDVPEVDQRDELLGRHVDEELPEWLAGGLRVEVPDRVDDGRRREVDDALLGTDPAQLAVADERRARRRPCPRTASSVERPTTSGRKRPDRGHDDLGAAPDRERQPVPFQAVRGRPSGRRRTPPSSPGRGSWHPSRRGCARSGSARRGRRGRRSAAIVSP